MSRICRRRLTSRVRFTLAVGIAVAVVTGLVATPAASAAGPSPTPRQPTSFSVTSFDGITITGDYFTAAGAGARHRAPTVLYGPGWGGAAFADATLATSPSSGTIGVAPLLAAGYNVVSWNPRGFGTSTGQAEADSAFYEGRDVSAILDWVATQPWAQLDRPGDPRVGMVGGSYGGEVQWAAAAVDHRIDAIAPDISWNSLLDSLDPNDTAKTAWDALLYGSALAAGQRDNPQIDQAFTDGQATFQLTAADRQFLAAFGRNNLAAAVRAPALILQGTVDTLFPLGEAARNYAALSAHHVPVKMVWFCGGHGVCLTSPGDTSIIQSATLSWFARYLKRQPVNTGPGFDWVDQQGTWHAAPTYRANSVAGGVSANGSGALALAATGGSGPYTGPGADQLGPEAAVIATPASNAVNVAIQFRRAASVVGAPTLTIAYSGRASSPAARILAQVVDDSTGIVLGSQLTPIPVTLDGRHHTLTVSLRYLAATAQPGSTFTLQLVADSSQFDTHPTGGKITFSSIRVSLPTAAGLVR